jgi:hypothetical protein
MITIHMSSLFFIAFFNLLFYYVLLFFVTHFIFLVSLDFYIACDICIPFSLHCISFDSSFCSFIYSSLSSNLVVLSSLALLVSLLAQTFGYFVSVLISFALLYLIICNRFLYSLFISQLSFYRFIYYDLYFLFLFYFIFVFINLFGFFITDLFLFFIFLDFFGLFIDLLVIDTKYFNSFAYCSTFICY